MNNNNLCSHIASTGEGTFTVEGITKLLEALKGSSVAALGCACHPKAFAFVSAPIDAPTFSPIPILPLARSLAGNTLGGNPNPLGIGIPDGASQRGVFVIAAALNETKITALECAAAPLRFANTCFLLACPPSQKANTFRKRTHSSSESEHVPFLVPSGAFPSLVLPEPSSALRHRHTHEPPFLPSPSTHDVALNCALRGPRPRPPVGRVGRACSRAHLTPPATSPSQYTL